MKRFAGFAVQVAFLLEIFLKLGRIQAIRTLIDVNKIRTHARLRDSLRSRNEGMWDCDDDVARLDA